MKAGWEATNLAGVLATIRNGVNCKQTKAAVGDRISRIESIADGTFNLEKTGRSELSAKDKEKFKLRNGDILFSHINSPPHVGKTAVFDLSEDVFHGVNLLLFRPVKAVDAAYLEHYLKHLHSTGYWRTRCKQSVNQASVNQTDIGLVPFPLPPLDEQKRIVEILDAAFEGLTRARAHTEINLQNAGELFGKVIEEQFSNFSSNAVTFEEICADTLIGLVRNTQDQAGDRVYPYVKMNNISNFGAFDKSKQARVDCSSEELSRYRLEANDFLFNTRNSFELVGKTCIFSNEWAEPTVFNNNIMRVRFKPHVDPHFIRFAFQTSAVKMRVEAFKSGTTSVVGIYHKSLKNLRLPLPALDIQETVVEQLTTISDQCDTLQSHYRAKLAELDALRQALLQKAFAGELT